MNRPVINRQGTETGSAARADGWMLRLGEWWRWYKSQRRLSHLPEHLRCDVGIGARAFGYNAGFQPRAV